MPARTLTCLLSLVTAQLAVSVTLAGEPDTDALTDINATIVDRAGQYSDIAHRIWAYNEVGFQETRSSALLQQTLAAEGFSIQAGVAGMPTAFVASYGQGEPVVALLAEYDALPGISQAASAERAPGGEAVSGHACGHHLLGTASVAAAVAVRHWLEATGQAGTIRLYGTPAEEGGSGKVYLVREGLFKDVDAVLAWHPSDDNRITAQGSLANRSAKFRFHGVSAHAARAPHKARSALDGVEAFNFMVNLMREHVPAETRIHYVITNGGGAPNVVPDFAEVYYYVRHPHTDTLVGIWDRIEQAASAAAQGTGTTVDREILHGNYPLVPNPTLSQLLQENLEQVGGVEYDATEQAFAEEIYTSLNQPENPLGSQAQVFPMEVSTVFGSTDVGDISWNVPTAQLEAATWVPGTSAHSWQAIAAGGMSIGAKGMQVAARTMALSARQLYLEPARLQAAWDELNKTRGENFHYTPLLGDRPPPLDYRK